MTDKPDLTPEQLDALEGDYVTTDGTVDVAIDDLAALIKMARAKQAAEEETAMFKQLVTEKMQLFLDLGVSAGIDRALKLVNEKHDAIERAEAAERERDALRGVSLETLTFLDVDGCIDRSCGWWKVVTNGLRVVLAQPTTEGGE